MAVAQLVEWSLQRSTVHIQSSAKFILIAYCELYWKDKNKEKRRQEWPIYKLFGQNEDYIL